MSVWRPLRDRYHELRVKQIAVETDDARSICFEIPDDLADTFRYQAGQFVTLRFDLDGDEVFRSYSMSSSPAVDEDLQITVKRVDGGLVSNWLHDKVAEGDIVEVGPPGGAFVLGEGTGDIVAFAGGSGITPVFSIVKSALATTDRRIRLLFANQHRGAAIFGAELDELRAGHPDRLVVEHHDDSAAGLLTPSGVRAFAGDLSGIDVYLCGPAPFMDLVESTLVDAGIDADHLHLERFNAVPAEEPVHDEFGLEAHAPSEVEIEITMGRHTERVAQMGTATILQSARWCGLPARSSCETGHCAVCMALVVEGEVKMHANDVLTPDEVEEGWVLTCQAVPISPFVHVIYDP